MPFGVTLAYIVAFIAAGWCIWLAYQSYRKQQQTATNYAAMMRMGGEATQYELSIETKERAQYFELRDGTAPCDRRRIMAALFFRALALIPRIHKLQKDAPGVMQSRKQNIVPEEYYQSFKKVEAVVNEEAEDIQREADKLQPEWSETILAEANQRWHQFEHQKQAEIMQRKKAKQDARAQKQAESERREKEASQRRKDEKRAEKVAKQLESEESSRAAAAAKKTLKTKQKLK